MKVNEIVEARRNPELNANRLSGHQEAIQYLHASGLDNNENTGIRMTKTPKMGLNPQSVFKTPLGICFYPVNYYLARKEKQHVSLPFADDYPYIQIFTWDNARELHIDYLDDNQYQQILTKLKRMYDEVEVFGLDYKSKTDAKIRSPGGFLWYVTMKLIDADPIKWNSLFRKLGYDIIIDHGAGIIHGAERTQGVILNPRIINHMNQIQQSYRTPANKDRHSDPIFKIMAAINWGRKLPKTLEDHLIQRVSPSMAVKYAINSLKGRFEKAEEYIAKSVDTSVPMQYAKVILKDPDPATWAQRYLASIDQ